MLLVNHGQDGQISTNFYKTKINYKMENQVNQTVKQSPVRDAEGNFLIKKEWLGQYAIIDGPGTYKDVVVVSEPQLYDPAEYGEEGNPRFIVNLRCILASDLPKVRELFKGKDFVKADALKGIFMNGNVWVNEGSTPNVPHRKQHVEIIVDYVEDREGNQVLRVTDIFPAAAKSAKKINLDAMFADERLQLDDIE